MDHAASNAISVVFAGFVVDCSLVSYSNMGGHSSMSTFQRMNTRAAKATGEAVMEIRRRYAAMESYPSIRQAIMQQFGITLSVQQITRIAKGISFAQLPVLPTEREVTAAMHSNAALMHAAGFEPQERDVAASLERTLKLLKEPELPDELKLPTKDQEPTGEGMARLQSLARELSAEESEAQAQQKVFKCTHDECGQVFETNVELARHQLGHL